MHIMFIPSWYSNDRNKVHGSFFKEQALALQENGVKVTVAYNEIWPLTLVGKIKEKSGLKFDIEDGLNTYRYKNYNFLPKSPLMFKIFNKRMEKLLKEIEKHEGKVDVLHAQSSLWGGISAAYLSKKYNIPLVITEHSSVERGKYVRESYLPYIIESYKTADKVIAVGNGLKKELERLSGREDIEVIGNLIHFSKFPLKEKSKNSKFIFFSLAFLEGEKGFDILIKSFGRAFKDRDDVILVIGGNGSQRVWLESITKEEHVEEKVNFVGELSREEVSKWMRKADAFVLPSRYETFGVVYIEALASGTPVIGTFNGGAEDIINDTNGYIVEIDNVEMLSEALKDIVRNNQEFEPEKLRKSCFDKFSPENISSKIIKIYKDISNEGELKNEF